MAFTHLPETDLKFDLGKQDFGEPYCAGVMGGASKVGDRVQVAVSSFAKFTETGPLVVVIDVMFWWVGMRFQGYGNPQIQDPKYVLSHFDKILQQYRDGIVGLVQLVKDGCFQADRSCVVVGKANHNPSYEEGTVELKLHLAMREVLRGIFDGSDGKYFFDWYAVANQAKQDGKWDMLDWLHQGPLSSQVETVAFEAFTRETLPEGFSVNLGGNPVP